MSPSSTNNWWSCGYHCLTGSTSRVKSAWPVQAWAQSLHKELQWQWGASGEGNSLCQQLGGKVQHNHIGSSSHCIWFLVAVLGEWLPLHHFFFFFLLLHSLNCLYLNPWTFFLLLPFCFSPTFHWGELSKRLGQPSASQGQPITICYRDNDLNIKLRKWFGLQQEVPSACACLKQDTASGLDI